MGNTGKYAEPVHLKDIPDRSLQQEQVGKTLPLTQVVRPRTGGTSGEPVLPSEILQFEVGNTKRVKAEGNQIEATYVPHETIYAPGGVEGILQLE
jgi:hypothetical protein